MNDLQGLMGSLPASGITVLNLHDHKIGDDGVKALARVLPDLPELANLDLSNNDITCEGFSALAEKLCECCSLKELDLSYNDVRSDGMVALANYLKRCLSVTVLTLPNNPYLGKQGIEIFAHMLPMGYPIVHLDLSNTSIKVEGSTALAEALRKLPGLCSLRIAGNLLRDAGTKRIVKVFLVCKALMEVDLSHNHIANEGFEVLSEVAPLCKALQMVHVKGNIVHKDDVQKMLHAQRRHGSLKFTGLDCLFVD
jgi:Ran GTPase-activating protein (RanGAP) involved in mRNA processing and transport